MQVSFQLPALSFEISPLNVGLAVLGTTLIVGVLRAFVNLQRSKRGGGGPLGDWSSMGFIMDLGLLFILLAGETMALGVVLFIEWVMTRS